eukprot:CAMPEP_0183336566 /NCGR_PEP_ID=MMETSP0164_2-20130417/4505_1 /TAXON_ID=221442 /ORGANISM="Coccolithus pelagicus ssp braarudi, Strain PLY182g" /LENGTH=326 /DNA_ID=CAMNT_0025506107 /DNA_START=109 /DNA_END=1089 /DNA_ORIENTATION=-
MAAHLSLVELSPTGSSTKLPVHISRPSVATPEAAVIVCHHAVGIYQDEFLKKYCDNLASLGFLVALPDFYHRAWAACPPRVAETRGAGLNQKEIPVPKLIFGLTDEGMVADVAAVVEHIETVEKVAAIGIHGFCLGGRLSWLAACALPDKIRALSMCHGGNIFVAMEGRSLLSVLRIAVGQLAGSWLQRWIPRGIMVAAPTPYDMRGRMKCAVIGHFGALDANPSPADADTLKAGLEEAGVTDVSFFVYEGATHAFCSGESENYQKAGSDLAWQRTASFFLQKLLHGNATATVPPAVGKSSTSGSACGSGCAEIAATAGPGGSSKR